MAFSLCNILKGSRFSLLNYMATRRDFRNLGIGSRLFLKTYSHFRRITQLGDILLLEVETPITERSDEKSVRLRRIHFYERLGAEIIPNFRYILPPLSEKYPTEMILMAFTDYISFRLTGSTLRDVLISIYGEVYERDSNDPFLSEMLCNLSDDWEIQLHGGNQWN